MSSNDTGVDPNNTEQFLSNLFLNLGIATGCIIFFTYIGPRVPWCYTPRLAWKNENARVDTPPHLHFGFCRFFWIRRMFSITEEELLAYVGVDGYMYLRFFQLGLKYFSLVSVAAIVLLAIDVKYGDAELGNTGFDSYTISNLEPGSDLLFVHLAAAYCFTALLVYLLWREFHHYIEVRRKYYLTHMNNSLAARLSVLVQDIPSDIRSQAEFETFFSRLYPNAYVASSLAYDTRKVDKIIQEREAVFRKWEHHTYKLLELKLNRALESRNKTKGTDNLETTGNFRCNPFLCCCKPKDQNTDENEGEKQSTCFSICSKFSCPKACTKGNGEEDQESGRFPICSKVWCCKSRVDDNNEENQEATRSSGRCFSISCGGSCWKKSGSENSENESQNSSSKLKACCKLLTCGVCASETSKDSTDSPSCYTRICCCIKRGSAKESSTNGNKEKPIRRPKLRPYICAKKVDAIHYYSNRIEELNDEISAKAKSHEMKPYASGFVTFANFEALTIADQIAQVNSPFQMKTRLAPEPDDVIWHNLRITYWERNMRRFVGIGVVVLLVVFYTIPVSFAASLSTLSNFSEFFPKLGSWIESNPSLAAFLEGFLPGLALIIFMALLPLLCESISKFLVGIEAQSWVERDVLATFFYFQIFNFFLATTIAGAFFQVAEQIIDNPASIVSLLSESLPAQASTFLSYVMLRTLADVPLGMLRLVPLIVGTLKLRYVATTEHERNQVTLPDTINYGTEYGMHLLIWIIGLTYAPVSPYLVPFVALFFLVRVVVCRYEMMYVYAPRYESGGFFFPMIFNRIIVGCLVGHLTLVGVFSLKEGYIQSTLMLVAFFSTLAFWRFVNGKLAPAADRLTREETNELDQRLLEPQIIMESKGSIFVCPALKPEEIDVRAQYVEVQSQVINNSKDPINVEFEEVTARIDTSEDVDSSRDLSTSDN